MAINVKILSKDTLTVFRKKMKQVNKLAVATDAQQYIVNAVVIGTCNALKKTRIASTTPFPPKLGTKKGIGLVLNPKIMVKAAVKAMQASLGSKGGTALTRSMEAFMEPMAAHFKKNVEVEAIGPNGGQGGSPVNMTAAIIEAAILKELPRKEKKQILTSKAGKFFIKSVSAGIAAGMKIGKPGAVPVTGDPSGNFTGKFI